MSRMAMNAIHAVASGLEGGRMGRPKMERGLRRRGGDEVYTAGVIYPGEQARQERGLWVRKGEVQARGGMEGARSGMHRSRGHGQPRARTLAGVRELFTPCCTCQDSALAWPIVACMSCCVSVSTCCLKAEGGTSTWLPSSSATALSSVQEGKWAG